MIHLMELPNPDKLGERPAHGGRDRHFCIGIEEGGLVPLREKLDAEGACRL
jgi:glyoxylase I family protein